MKSQLNSRIVLLFSLILLFQACDWFGGEEDKPQKKSTEFVFTVDTLKTLAQFQVNDLDVIDDTSFVVTGFFAEDDENGNTKNVYNQIWWGKKKGYEFKSEKLIGNNNNVYEIIALDYFENKLDFYVFGAFSLVAIKSNNSYSYHYLGSNINGDQSYEHAELIRPGEFYLYGRNGSLVYYKDGRFTKIDTGTSLTLSHASKSNNDDDIYFYLSPKTPAQVIDSAFYTVGLLKVNQTNVVSKFNMSVLQQMDYPFFIQQLLIENDSLFIYGNQGIYYYSESKPSIELIRNELLSSASFINANDGFSHLLGQITYWQDGINYKQQLPNTIPLRDLYFMDYKNNRVTMINSSYNIITGIRRDE